MALSHFRAACYFAKMTFADLHRERKYIVRCQKETHTLHPAENQVSSLKSAYTAGIARTYGTFLKNMRVYTYIPDRNNALSHSPVKINQFSSSAHAAPMAGEPRTSPPRNIHVKRTCNTVLFLSILPSYVCVCTYARPA